MDLSKFLRGQAAMEYLMTYGWALLVIVIAIAILLIINPFSPPAGCRFEQVGFTCANPVVDSAGKLYVKIENNQNNGIKVCAVKCTTDKTIVPPAGITNTNCFALPVLARQATLDVSTLTVKCQSAVGVVVSGGAGTEVTGKVYLYYMNEEDTATYAIRTASANLATKMVQ